MSTETDDEILVDTSKMSKGQREALQMVESAREKKVRHPSFARQLFMGHFADELVLPFPSQSPEDKKLGDAFLQRLSTALDQHCDPDLIDETRELPKELLDALNKAGAFGMKVPTEYGGEGLSQLNFGRAMMHIGSYCGSTAVLLSVHQSVGVPQPLKLFGTEGQKAKFYPRIAKGGISAFALTEPDVGSDPAKMTTTATPSEDGSHYIINGRKLWCTNGPIADVMVVMAQTPPKLVKGKERKQITAFIVEANTPGIEVLHRCDFMGYRGIQNGLLQFTEVKVPRENILGGEGRGLALALTTLNTGRLTIPAMTTGAAKQSVAIARQWCNERVQWGQPIGYHEACRAKLAFMAATTLSMEAVTWLTSRWADMGTVDIRMEAAMTKLYTTEAGWQVLNACMQLRGGRGYERAWSLKARGEIPYPVERMLRDARVNTIIEGTSEIMRLFLAREAMDPHLTTLANLIRPGASVGTKLAALPSILGFYGKWYPARWMPGSGAYPSAGPLEPEFRQINRISQRLARALFHQMAKHGEKLEPKQVLMSHLTDIGVELFAMAATCSYALTLDRPAIGLAQYFCKIATARIESHFQALKYGETTNLGNQLAEQLLNEELAFIEEGVHALKF